MIRFFLHNIMAMMYGKPMTSLERGVEL